jgi:hypothetical protein
MDDKQEGKMPQSEMFDIVFPEASTGQEGKALIYFK